MKNTIYTTIILAILLISTSCSGDLNFDDESDSLAPVEGTDFNQDISNTNFFYLTTPTELKILDNELNEDNNLVYQVGDTLKFELEFDANYQETENEFYDLFKSTGAEAYEYSINLNNALQTQTHRVIDLNLLEEFPEIKNLTDIEIRTHPVFRFLFLNINNLQAQYDTETGKYTSRAGIVLQNSNTTNLSNIIYSSHTSNATFDKSISISIPIITALDFVDGDLIITDE